jgi:hypothetical protein
VRGILSTRDRNGVENVVWVVCAQKTRTRAINPLYFMYYMHITAYIEVPYYSPIFYKPFDAFGGGGYFFSIILFLVS